MSRRISYFLWMFLSTLVVNRLIQEVKDKEFTICRNQLLFTIGYFSRWRLKLNSNITPIRYDNEL